MSNGYPNEGPDSRVDFLGILKWMQNKFSKHSKTPPRWLIRFVGQFQYWFTEPKTYVAFGIAWPPYLVWQGVGKDGNIVPTSITSEHPDGLRWVAGETSHIRLGWRYDPNWEGGGYIFPTVAMKLGTLPFPMEKGY